MTVHCTRYHDYFWVTLLLSVTAVFSVEIIRRELPFSHLHGPVQATSAVVGAAAY